MTLLNERGFRTVAISLSLLGAVIVTRNFDEYYWFNLVLTAVSFAVASIGLRRLWDKAYPAHRSYALYFFLFFTFWLVIWFWSADDFLPDYPLTVFVTALICAVLCLPLHWERVWTEARQPYAVCYLLGLATACGIFWAVQSRALRDVSYAFIPIATAYATATLALAWRFVLRRPVLWFVRRRATRASASLKEASPQTTTRFQNPAPQMTERPARRPSHPPSRRESIGLLYDIDELLKADKRHINYGQPARYTFMKRFDPQRVGPALLWQGDTKATLAGEARRWCIAITPERPGGVRAFREMFGTIEAPGLLAPAERFVLRPVDVEVGGVSLRPIRNEPLTQWLNVNEAGEIVLIDPIDEDVVLCRKFGHRFRLPEKLAEFVAGIHKGTLSPDEISGDEPIAEVSAVFAAVNFEREGVPGTLKRFAKHYNNRNNDIYARHCVGQMLPILDWTDRKVNARADAADVRSAREYLSSLGYQALPKVVIRCPNGHRLRVASRESGWVRCPECDRLGRRDALFEVQLSDQ